MKSIILILMLITGGWSKTLSQNIKKHSVSFSSSKIEKTAKKYLGRRYRFGGFDCSKFTQTVYKKHHKNIPRTARGQAKVGKHIKKSKLKKGDLVFFKNTYKHGISHVGIYIGNNKFIHASSAAKKVTISSLNKAYYKNHYAGARRLIKV